jgi:hypothetical protein
MRNRWRAENTNGLDSMPTSAGSTTPDARAGIYWTKVLSIPLSNRFNSIRLVSYTENGDGRKMGNDGVMA